MPGPVVIVGAGHAGGRAAERLRHHGWTGGIVLIGDESALPYERPSLSKAMLLDDPLPGPVQVIAPASLAALGISHLGGKRAVRIDRGLRRVWLSDGEAIDYGALVLATGLTPRQLPALPPLAERIVVLRTLDEARTLRQQLQPGRRLLIVGAGFIGLEVAAAAAQRGVSVSVVELADRALARALPKAFSDWLTGLHRENGVSFLFRRGVISAQLEGSEVVLRLDDGTDLRGDCVLVGAGGVPNDGLARDAGLAVSDGIEVDATCRTSDPLVYAVGDVARHPNPLFATLWRLESWRNAEDTAATAARAICGMPVPYAEVPWFWTDQLGYTIQITGQPLAGDRVWTAGQPGFAGHVSWYLAADRPVGAIGISAARAMRKARDMIRAGHDLDPAGLAALGLQPAALPEPAAT